MITFKEIIIVSFRPRLFIEIPLLRDQCADVMSSCFADLVFD